MTSEPMNIPKIGDIVIHKQGGAPWLVLEVAFGLKPREMVIARRESTGIVEGVRPIKDYVIAESAP